MNRIFWLLIAFLWIAAGYVYWTKTGGIYGDGIAPVRDGEIINLNQSK